MASYSLPENVSPDEYRLSKLNDEYATQFLGFSPTSVTDGIYNAIYDYIHDILSSLQKFIIGTFGDVTSEEKVSKGTEEILQKSTALLDKVFDRLELYLRMNILNVPEHVLLPEDEVHSSTRNRMRTDEIQEKIELVEEEIRKERRRRACLIEAKKRQNIILDQYDKFEEELEELHKLTAKHGVFDIADSLVFINDQVQKLIVKKNNKEE